MEQNSTIIALLNSEKLEDRHDGLKKVILAMSNGKDLKNIFQSVIKCFDIDDLKTKKMIYLYLSINSKDCPTDALMVVNQF